MRGKQTKEKSKRNTKPEYRNGVGEGRKVYFFFFGFVLSVPFQSVYSTKELTSSRTCYTGQLLTS